MFERIMEKAARVAERRAEARVLQLTEEMLAQLPPGVRAEAAAEGVVISGRGLRQRLVTEAGLRWLRLR